MAENYLKGTEFLFYVDTTTSATTALNAVTLANAKLVKCLTSNGFSGTTNTIESNSKCAGLWAESIADTAGWTMDFSAEALELQALDTSIDQNALFNLWKNKTVFWGFMYDIASVTLRYGLMRIDSYSDTGAKGSIQEFSGTLTGIGVPGDQTTIAP